MKQKYIIICLIVLPCAVVEKPFSYLKKKKNVEFYKNNLSPDIPAGLDSIVETEYEFWQAKWKNIEEKKT